MRNSFSNFKDPGYTPLQAILKRNVYFLRLLFFLGDIRHYVFDGRNGRIAGSLYTVRFDTLLSSSSVILKNYIKKGNVLKKVQINSDAGVVRNCEKKSEYGKNKVNGQAPGGLPQYCEYKCHRRLCM